MALPARSLLSTLLAAATLSSVALADNPPPVVLDPPTTNVIKQIPVGKTLLFPLTATQVDGKPLTYKVTSSNARVLVRAKTGNPIWRLGVSYGGGQTGEMVFQLFREWTPVATGLVSGFAQSGFYDNVIFHRVIKGFVLQGGDPLGTGSGGPGMSGGVATTAYKFDNEFQPGLIFSGRGQLAMANSGFGSDYAGSNGSQFFITLEQLRAPTAIHQLNLDFKHTVFGQMLSGWETMDAIANTAVDGSSKPTQDVKMTSSKIEPDNHDAVLMLSATGVAANVTITITVDDGQGGKDTKTMVVSAVADTVNDPPVVKHIDPQVSPVRTEVDFALTSFDLERDYLFLNHGLLTNSANAQSTSSGTIGGVLGNAGFSGQVRFGVNISQYDVGSATTDTAIVDDYGLIGVGDRAVRADSVTISAAPAASFSGTVAQFSDTDPAGAPSDFAAKINWGDGTVLDVGTLVRDSSVAGVSVYKMTGTHTYAKAGIYTVISTISGAKGAEAEARSQAIVTADTLVATGEKLDIKGASVSNRIVATFTDSDTPLRPVDYAATVDWGDGTFSKGVVAKGGSPHDFVVRGTHAYKDAEPFAISVRVHKVNEVATADSYAWSTVNITGFAPVPHLPPFALVHLIGAWNSGPSKVIVSKLVPGVALDPATLTENLTGNFVVINSGNKASAQSIIRFFLSADTTVGAGDLQLKVNGQNEITVVGFAGGAGGSGTFTLNLPKGTTGTGKYLLTQLVYSDPIMDASAIDKVVVSGPIDPAIIAYNVNAPLGSSSGYYLTSENLPNNFKVTFSVVLDTAPTADVVFPVTSSDTTEGTVTPSSLTFTAANWKTPQTVTVTGVDDATKDGAQTYTIKIASPTTTDPNYNGIPDFTIPFANLDND